MVLKTRYFFLFLFLIITTSKFSYAQNSKNFIGDWKVIKVDLSPNAEPKEKEMLQIVAPIFLKSTFHFKTNNQFSFDSPDKDLAIKNGIWKLDVEKNYIRVTEKPLQGTTSLLMGIIVKVSSEGFLFFIEETPLILTVVKKM